jgi:integrase
VSSYDVKVWNILTNKGSRRATYTVRWFVAGKGFRDTFATKALAESFRAKLVIAQREGVAFDEGTGLPEPMARELHSRTWYQHAVAFVDMKWARASPKHRKSIAEALTTVTPALLSSARGAPPDKVLRAAMLGWAFNTGRRQSTPPEQIRAALAWLESNTVDLVVLQKDAVIVRGALDAISHRLDGTLAAATTVARKRAVFSSALKYAVELRLLKAHPFTYVSWTAPKSTEVIDRRVVVNPHQARSLLDATAQIAPDFVAFFGCMYYAALRPEEALHLRTSDFIRPARPGEWGWLHLTGATVTVGHQWSDDGVATQDRGLKHRAATATRPVPVAPPLVDLLLDHIDVYSTAPDGRLFVTRRGAGGRYLPTSGRAFSNNAYTRVWRRARALALTPAEAASPLARVPYDLRHAAVSFWLNAGVPAPQVAEWAGHSVHVLMKVYAKCIDGQEDAALKRVEVALRRS